MEDKKKEDVRFISNDAKLSLYSMTDAHYAVFERYMKLTGGDMDLAFGLTKLSLMYMMELQIEKMNLENEEDEDNE